MKNDVGRETMKKTTRLLPLVALLSVSAGFFCKYCIRDVTFVEIGTPPYRLTLVINESFPKEKADAIRKAAEDLLGDTILQLEIVPVETVPDHPIVESLRTKGMEEGEMRELKDLELPKAILTAPYGEEKEMPFPEDPVPYLTSIVDNPLVEKILDKTLSSFAVIMILEGEKKEDNDAAKKAAKEATEYINEQLEFMPKPIEVGPQTLVVDMETWKKEEFLFWTLGIPVTAEVTGTRIQVMGGRGRPVGPLLSMEEIDHVGEVLGVVGYDCECNLDRRWMQGQMVPHRWNEKRQEAAAKALGFDPGDPMVRMEVYRILGRGPSSIPPQYFGNDPEEPVIDYRKINLPDVEDPVTEIVPEEPEAGTDPVPAAVEKTPLPIPEKLPPTPTEKEEAPASPEGTPLRTLYIALGTAAGLVLLIGFILVLKGRGNA